MLTPSIPGWVLTCLFIYLVSRVLGLHLLCGWAAL